MDKIELIKKTLYEFEEYIYKNSNPDYFELEVGDLLAELEKVKSIITSE